MNWAQTTLSRLAEYLATNSQPHSLVVLDMDGLTSINAAYGRAHGDAVLDSAEARLAAVFDDILSERWLGDQFVVVFPFTAPTVAASRIRDVLVSPPGVMPRYSMSAGGATCPVDGRTNLELMATASKALRRAKARGPAHVEWS